jgi:hypothetical protein
MRYFTAVKLMAKKTFVPKSARWPFVLLFNAKNLFANVTIIKAEKILMTTFASL